MTEVVAETARLRLRTWGEGDGDRFYAALNNPAVMRWLGGVQDRATWGAALARLDGYQRDFGHSFWLVERRVDGGLLGFCGLKQVNADGTDLQGQFEVGWRFREIAWGQGFAKEAAIATLEIAFGRFGAPHIVAFTVASNRGSWGLMERLGMIRREDLDFNDPRYGPDLNPTIVYRVDAADWPAARAAALA